MEKILLGERLKELRTKHGYTLEGVSLFLGIDQNLTAAYESGQQSTSVDVLEELGELYCCDLIHEPPVVSPVLHTTSYVDSITVSDMKAIQVVNRIVLNSIFMANLLKED